MRLTLKLTLSVGAITAMLLTSGLANVLTSPPRDVRVLVAKKKDKHGQQTDERHLPVAELNSPEPADPAKRALRKVRSKRHNLSDPSLKPSDLKKFVLTENSVAVNFGGPWSSAPDEPALPTDTSDVIVVGEITEARAFVSDDETSIYSEFTVLVNDVLKDKRGVVLPGARLTAERSGGALRFPSGKLLVRGLLGKPLPKMNSRYVLFLRRIDDRHDEDDFSIMTAYEMQRGSVIPLDGLSPSGELVGPFSSYQRYRGVDEQGFITQIRTSIEPGEVRKGGRK